MVDTFTNGKAAVNQICATFGAGLRVFDLALDIPTPDIVERDALTEAECAATMAFGMEALAGEPDLLVPRRDGHRQHHHRRRHLSRALWRQRRRVGRPGTGSTGEVLARKIAAVEAAVKRCAGQLDDPLEVLRRLGGREVAAMAGAILAARMQRVPVVLDGYVVTAAAAVLHALNPAAIDHCLAGHVSAEPAHRRVLEKLGLAPILDLGMRLGEGSGAALSIGVIKAALACHSGMATFAEAGVG